MNNFTHNIYLIAFSPISLLKLNYKKLLEFFMTVPPKPHNFCIDTPLQSKVLYNPYQTKVICYDTRSYIMTSNIKVFILKLFASLGLPTFRANAWREGSIIAKKALAEKDFVSYLSKILPEDNIYIERIEASYLGRYDFGLLKIKHYIYYRSLLTSIYDALCIKYNVVPLYKKPSHKGFIIIDYDKIDGKIEFYSRTLARHHFMTKFVKDPKFRLML